MVDRTREGGNCNQMVEDINNFFIQSAEKTLGRHKLKKHTKKRWYNKKCSDLKKEVKWLGKMLHCDPNNIFVRGKFYTRKKEYKKFIRKEKRDYKNNLIQKIKKYHKCDPKSYWKMVDELRKLEQRNINDAEKIDPDIWIQHYNKLLCVDNVNDRNEELRDRLKTMEAEGYFSELDYEINNTEIITVIKGLKNNKATGLDCISNEMIKISLPVFLPIYQFSSLYIIKFLTLYLDQVFIQYPGMRAISLLCTKRVAACHRTTIGAW